MLRRILIVGGGTAGWLCACYLARSHRAVEIELVESASIASVGVGEGTFPSIRGTLARIGISEARFIQATGATFKQGIRFDHWVRPPGTAGADHYFHPFNSPSARVEDLDLVAYWLLGEAPSGNSLAESVTMQKATADAGLGPKRRGDPDFQGPMNYAYHFDAARFAGLLSEHGQSLGVRHRWAEVEQVELQIDGSIEALILDNGERLQADLYIDCSGQRARLIGEALGERLQPLDDVLFVDRAVAIQVPHPHPGHALPSYTIASAQTAGWIWDIALQERRGLGHVYSSRYCDREEAERILRLHIGPQAAELPARHLSFQTGYRNLQWKHNCVAVGLSAGFLEPLESTGIGLIEIASYLVTHLLPSDGACARAAAHFNRMMTERYTRIVDFIKLHYCLSQRRDSQFWIDNTDRSSVPASLLDRLAEWRYRAPHRLDFITDLEMFMPASWQFVLYGMEFRTDLSHQRASYPQAAAARQEFEMLRQVSRHALKDLPANRALLDSYLQAPQREAARG